MWERSEGEGTLHLAHVVIEDGLRAVRLGQVEAVVNLEALVDRLWGRERERLECSNTHFWGSGRQAVWEREREREVRMHQKTSKTM